MYLNSFTNRMLIAYIMVPLVQKEIDMFKDTVWNSHRIRAQKDTILPDGVPNHIYSFPEQYGLQDCGMHSICTIKYSVLKPMQPTNNVQHFKPFLTCKCNYSKKLVEFTDIIYWFQTYKYHI